MFIDISRPIHEGMPIYPNNPPVDIRSIQNARDGKSALSMVALGSHTGTHIDALSHISDDAPGIESYSLDQYIGVTDVVEIDSGVSVIRAGDIPPTSSDRIIFKTKNSLGDINVFDEDFTALHEDAAEELLRRNICLVGIDALSIKKKGVRDNVHALFLEHNVVILEGLWLANVIPGQYRLVCLPLSLAHTDGVPARAILAPLQEAQ